MGVSVFPAPSAASKTQFRTTLTSGTSYTVPANVTYLNVTLVGGGGGGGGAPSGQIDVGNIGLGGSIISSTLSATAGGSIAYAIGAGGAGGGPFTRGSTGGTTTFTGATSATGGSGGNASSSSLNGQVGSVGIAAANGGDGGANNSGTGGNGGSGAIYIEYWV